MSIQHYANKSVFEGNVVDNVLINPYIGVRFDAFFAFDIRLGYLQGMQRDRMLQEGWKAPMGGEFNFRMSKWGVFIDNNLYFGKNLMPLYHHAGKDGLAYGSDLYSGDPFYGTSHHIYNRTGIGLRTVVREGQSERQSGNGTAIQRTWHVLPAVDRRFGEDMPDALRQIETQKINPNNFTYERI